MNAKEKKIYCDAPLDIISKKATWKFDKEYNNDNKKILPIRVVTTQRSEERKICTSSFGVKPDLNNIGNKSEQTQEKPNEILPATSNSQEFDIRAEEANEDKQNAGSESAQAELIIASCLYIYKSRKKFT